MACPDPRATVAVLGTDYGKGSHGHLVEEGHRLVTHDGEEIGFVEPNPFLEPAVEDTKDYMQAELINQLKAISGV